MTARCENSQRCELRERITDLNILTCCAQLGTPNENSDNYARSTKNIICFGCLIVLVINCHCQNVAAEHNSYGLIQLGKFILFSIHQILNSLHFSVKQSLRLT